MIRAFERGGGSSQASLVGVGMIGGMELHVSDSENFNFRSQKLGKDRSFCGISRTFLQISASDR